MKTAPTFPNDVRLDGTDKTREATGEVIQLVRNDQRDMFDWMSEKLMWWEARFSQMEQDMPSGWGSNIQLPISDLYCTRIAAAYMNVLFGGSRVTVMQPSNPEAFQNVGAAERMMEHLLRGGGVNSMPDLPMQMSAAINATVTYGIGVVKTLYSYKTRMSAEVIRRDAMPGILSKLIVVPNMSEEQRREEQQRFPDINRPEFQAIFGTLDVNPMNKRVFSELAPMIAQEVIRLYGLDTTDKMDKAALQDIMEYLRSGHKEPSTVVSKREIIEDCPRIKNVPIQDLFVPPGALLDFSRAERITEREWFTESQMHELAHDETWNKLATEEAIESGNRGGVFNRAGDGDDLTLSQMMYTQDDTGLMQDNLVEIWKIHNYEDIHGRGIPQLMVSTVEPESGAVLRKEPFLPAHGQMPYSAIPFEVTSPEYRSPRGIPKLLCHIEDHVNAWHRWLEDSMQISTSITLAVNRDSVPDAENIEWFPGLVLAVDDPSRDIQAIPMPQVDVPIERLEQFYLQWPERLVGDLAQSIEQGRGPERRTATEVATVDASRQRLMDMRARLFIHAMERPFQQVWSLWNQFGPTEAFVHITGEEPVRLTQSQTRGRFKVRPMAAIGPMDPAVRQQQMGGILDLAMQMQQIFGGDPTWEVNIPQMFVDLARSVDPLMADRNIRRRTPQELDEIAKNQEQQQAQQQEIIDIGQKIMANAITSPEEMLKFFSMVKRATPWGEFQQISGAKEAEEAAKNNKGDR